MKQATSDDSLLCLLTRTMYSLQELEAKKYELNDLASRLENTEQRLLQLQQDYIRADYDRDRLTDALKRFQVRAPFFKKFQFR